jgi:hypothetical protein
MAHGTCVTIDAASAARLIAVPLAGAAVTAVAPSHASPRVKTKPRIVVRI